MQLKMTMRLLAVPAALVLGCGEPRSLTKLDVNGSMPFAGVTLSLVASAAGVDNFRAAYAGVTIPQVGSPPLKVGLYLPSSMVGDVRIRGAALDGTCEIGAGTATIVDVQPGAVRETAMTLTFQACVPLPASPADAGPAEAGGARDVASDVAREVAPEVAPEAPCVSSPMAVTCGRRCDIDAIDNCGRTTRCSGCGIPGETCGGGGTPNVCGVCVDNGQTCLDRACGMAMNNCGQMMNCGMCNVRQMCCNGRCTIGVCL